MTRKLASEGGDHPRESRQRSRDRKFGVGLARAFGGAIFFSLPLLMTMEMWWLGFYMDRLRLAVFMLAFFPVLVGLCHFAGFEESSTLLGDAIEAIVAYAVGFVTAAAVLGLLGILGAGMPLEEIIGKISLQAVPASVGASLARSQLGGQQDAEEERRRRHAGYGGELFLMVAGAIFFAFNVAPTEEMVVIAFQMSEWHVLALVGVSLLMMHAFVYSVEFKGQATAATGTSGWSVFARYTLVGYAAALLISAYVLWTFGRYEESGLQFKVTSAMVLAFPASLGAAAARLVL